MKADLHIVSPVKLEVATAHAVEIGILANAQGMWGSGDIKGMIASLQILQEIAFATSISSFSTSITSADLRQSRAQPASC